MMTSRLLRPVLGRPSSLSTRLRRMRIRRLLKSTSPRRSAIASDGRVPVQKRKIRQVAALLGRGVAGDVISALEPGRRQRTRFEGALHRDRFFACRSHTVRHGACGVQGLRRPRSVDYRP